MQIRLCIGPYGNKSNGQIRLDKYFLYRILPEFDILCNKAHENFNLMTLHTFRICCSIIMAKN